MKKLVALLLACMLILAAAAQPRYGRARAARRADNTTESGQRTDIPLDGKRYKVADGKSTV